MQEGPLNFEIVEDAPATKREVQEIAAQILKETIDVESQPHESAIERNWLPEHTTMYLNNIAEDTKTLRSHEFAKTGLTTLMVLVFIVVLLILVFTGHKDLAQQISTHIVMLIGGFFGGSFWQRKQ